MQTTLTKWCCCVVIPEEATINALPERRRERVPVRVLRLQIREQVKLVRKVERAVFFEKVRHAFEIGHFDFFLRQATAIRDSVRSYA